MLRLFLFVSLFFLLHANPASAEGNCPPGYYPIGSPTTPGCAPIPAQQGAGNSEFRWSNRYGAIASDPSNALIAGRSKNKLSFEEADRAAISDCRKRGGGEGCRVQLSFGNSCAAYAVGDRTTIAQMGDSKKSAIEITKAECEEKSYNSKCRVDFWICSMPKIVY